ncbi:MAG: Ig-like domain-containing protein [Chloroflexota bacterium]|nr:Ig-like domain-containing protein [Chloroflexota bacterium]
MTIAGPAPSRPQAERRFWLIALGLIAAIAAATGLIILRGSTVSLPVATMPASGATISGKTLIGLTFPTAMQTTSVEAHLTIAPLVAGNWSWDQSGSPSDKIVRFIPLQPLTPGVTYHATLAKGAKAINGRSVGHDTTWQFTIRPPSLLFLRATLGGSPNLWTANADGSGARQITNERASVLEYSAAPDGSRIAYTTRETQQANALWAINLDGTGRTRLSPAGDPSIYATPAWSPAGDVIVYVLRGVVQSGNGVTGSVIGGINPSVTIGTSKLWAVAPDGRSLGRIYGRGDEVGFDPVWSPDGARLGFREQVNAQSEAAVVLSDLSPDPLKLPAGPGSRIAWSPDSGRAAYDESVPNPTGAAKSRIVIVGADGAGKQTFLGMEAGSESAPAWSPDGNRLLFIRQAQSGGVPTTDLWVANLAGTGRARLLGGDGLSSELPVWSPDGQSALVTRFNTTTGEDRAIWIVGADGRNAHPLILDGERVTWIP